MDLIYHNIIYISVCAQVHELPQSHYGDNREGTLFSWLHIYYAHLAFVRFEHSVCRGSLMTESKQRKWFPIVGERLLYKK